MKKTLLTLLLIFSIQISFGQVCGAYRIKYVGEVLNEDLEVVLVKLPTIPFLHGLEGEYVSYASKESFLKNNKVQYEISSPMTSKLFDEGSSYKEFYQSIRPNIPLIFVVLTEEGRQEIIYEIPWKKIKMKRLIDTGFGNLFKLDLGEIKLNKGPMKK